MVSIQVRAVGAGEYEVEVREGGSGTRHRVTADVDVAGVDEERVVEESFRFLLEREPKEAILARFELSVIGRYFPEYGREIRRRLGVVGG